MNTKTLFITTGDPNGIGCEVAIKALIKIRTKYKIIFVSHFSSEKKWISTLYKNKSVSKETDLKSALASDSLLVDLCLNTNPAIWVKSVAEVCHRNPGNYFMLTGPLSKGLIQKSGIKAIGHTEILKSVSKSQNAFMYFRGSRFNVALATGHIPIEKIAKRLKIDDLKKLILLISQFNKKLAVKKPIALLGLNPHAGDKGIISDFDQKKLLPLVNKLKLGGVSIEGPLVPDSAFTFKNQKKYSCFVCLYHDQGLIPFKMAHEFNEGVHLTLGISFFRSSVDHGPAFDIFGKSKANEGSFLSALKFTLDYMKKNKG